MSILLTSSNNQFSTPAGITDKPKKIVKPITNATESPATAVSNTTTTIEIPRPTMPMDNAAKTTITNINVERIILLVFLAKYVWKHVINQ